LHALYVELLGHELHLIDAHIQRVVDPLHQPCLCEVAPAVQVTLAALVRS